MRTRQVALMFWFKCSKQSSKASRVMVPRGMAEDSKRHLALVWAMQEHGHNCTGNFYYGWRYAR